MMANVYGNTLLPGIIDGIEKRPTGSIFRGPVEKDFYKVVTIMGTEDDTLSFGTIVKETPDGWALLVAADLAETTQGEGQDAVTVPAVIDSARIGIVVDSSAVFGSDAAPNTACVGLRGEADQGQLLLEAAAFDTLTDENKAILTTAFARWGIDLVQVWQG